MVRTRTLETVPNDPDSTTPENLVGKFSFDGRYSILLERIVRLYEKRVWKCMMNVSSVQGTMPDGLTLHYRIVHSEAICNSGTMHRKFACLKIFSVAYDVSFRPIHWKK